MMFGRKRMKDAEADAYVMRGLAGARGIGIPELQLRIEDSEGVRVSLVDLYYAVARLTQRGEITETAGPIGRHGAPRLLYARTLRLVA